jgi:hypothetical protein
MKYILDLLTQAKNYTKKPKNQKIKKPKFNLSL